MRVLALHARFVVVLVTGVMHQVQLIHQAAVLEHLEGAVDGDAIHFRVAFAGQLKELLGIQVLAGIVDEFEQNLALAGHADAALAK